MDVDEMIEQISWWAFWIGAVVILFAFWFGWWIRDVDDSGDDIFNEFDDCF